MKICWQEDVELTVVLYYDEEQDIPVRDVEIIKAGEEDEVDITSDHGETVDMQFGCGSMAYNVDKKLFIEVK
ncbi:MAG: hypothetical protein Q7T18_03380 [Sedimentisphaerales bacterium]|nr:hypothetical protein [Sedimentisphaerales bacterium]